MPSVVAHFNVPGFEDGRIRRAEVHWYEAHGKGKVKMKIKRFVE